MDGLNSRMAKNRGKNPGRELTNITLEITQSEKQRENRLKEFSTEIQGHVNNNKRSNICSLRIQKEGEIKSTQRNNAENFPNLTKDVNLQIQDFERIPNRIYPKKSTPRDIVMKLLKIKDPEKYLESSDRKATSFLYRKTNSDDSGFLKKNHEGHKEIEKDFLGVERK